MSTHFQFQLSRKLNHTTFNRNSIFYLFCSNTIKWQKMAITFISCFSPSQSHPDVSFTKDVQTWVEKGCQKSKPYADVNNKSRQLFQSIKSQDEIRQPAHGVNQQHHRKNYDNFLLCVFYLFCFLPTWCTLLLNQIDLSWHFGENLRVDENHA